MSLSNMSFMRPDRHLTPEEANKLQDAWRKVNVGPYADDQKVPLNPRLFHEEPRDLSWLGWLVAGMGAGLLFTVLLT